MEEMKKDQRLNLMLTEEEMNRLEELAATNAGKNKSMMVRELINLGWEKYQRLDLNPPKVEALAA